MVIFHSQMYTNQHNKALSVIIIEIFYVIALFCVTYNTKNLHSSWMMRCFGGSRNAQPFWIDLAAICCRAGTFYCFCAQTLSTLLQSPHQTVALFIFYEKLSSRFLIFFDFMNNFKISIYYTETSENQITREINEAHNFYTLLFIALSHKCLAIYFIFNDNMLFE